METNNQKEHKLDRDLFEELSEEEMHRLVLKAQQEAREQATENKLDSRPKRPFPKWMFWLIAVAMVVNVLAFFPQTFSIPAIKFLMTSAKLSAQEDIQTYKQAVVVITTEDSKGTGFSITSEGLILTNYHVIEGNKTVTVDFPTEGLFQAEVVASYPDIDVAVLEVNSKDLPYLDLAEQSSFQPEEYIYVIGNPLSFRGIANEGVLLDYLKLDGWEQDVLMLDAPIYRGNSGSPVINQEGQVVAIVFATLKHGEHGKVGLAVPIDLIHELGL